MSKRLYIGNLPFTVTAEDLTTAFEQWGPVESAAIITDHLTGQSKGFGFVQLSDATAADGIERMNGAMLKGRPLRVNEARPREGRPMEPAGRGDRPDRVRTGGYAGRDSAESLSYSGVADRSGAPSARGSGDRMAGDYRDRRPTRDDGPRRGAWEDAAAPGDRSSRDSSHEDGGHREAPQRDLAPREPSFRSSGSPEAPQREPGTRPQGGRDSGGRDSGGRDSGGRGRDNTSRDHSGRDEGGRDRGGRDRGGRDRRTREGTRTRDRKGWDTTEEEWE